MENTILDIKLRIVTLKSYALEDIPTNKSIRVDPSLLCSYFKISNIRIYDVLQHIRQKSKSKYV